MSRFNVLVVGASIAGPAAAYWLAKAGAKVTIIERFPSLRKGGQNIDIRTVGVSVMRKIPGMEAVVRAKTTEMEGMSFVNADGRPYGIIRATGNPDQQSLVSEYEIFRGDLARILFDLTKDNKNVKYIFGEQVASMKHSEQDEEPLTVEFTNGTPSTKYDLVVACDGATSRTRAIGFSCGVRDHIRPTNCWAAYFSMKSDLLEGKRVALGYSAIGGRFISVKPDPTGLNRISLWAMNPPGRRDAVLPFLEAMKQGDDALKRLIAQDYRGVGWKNEEIIQGLMEAEDLYASETVQVKVPSLSKGRFVLVGDAGYAPGLTGGGTSLALAGAYILAGELSMAKGDLSAGLRGYEEQMRPIIGDLQKVPPLVATILAPQTAWGIWLRNTIFAIVTRSRIIDLVQKLFAPFTGAFASNDKYKIREYEWRS